MAQLPPRDQRHQWLRYEGHEYTDEIIQDFKERLGRIFTMQVTVEETLTSFDYVHYCWERPTEGRKKGAKMFEGHFIVRLAENFRLLTKKRLQGLTLVVRDLTEIDMNELIRLWICKRLLEIPNWVALGLERQQVVTTRVAQANQEIPDEGAATPAPRTMTKGMVTLEEEVNGLSESLGEQRGMVTLEEEVNGLSESLGEQRVVLDTMSRDFSRFTTWAVGRLGQLLDESGVTYP
nr:hypothetical protein [Tanacetum cinerariifolium]